jgi:hypothetical protein
MYVKRGDENCKIGNTVQKDKNARDSIRTTPPHTEAGEGGIDKDKVNDEENFDLRDELDKESDDTESEGNEETTGDYETANSGYDGNEEDSGATDR